MPELSSACFIGSGGAGGNLGPWLTGAAGGSGPAGSGPAADKDGLREDPPEMTRAWLGLGLG